MPTIHAAATLPINPCGTSPVLTVEQVWEGLVEKSRKPQDGFVSVIKTCEVIEEKGEHMVRMVTFAPGAGPNSNTKPDEAVREEIVHFKPYKAEFVMPVTGSKTVNIVSQGETENELYLTFTFEWACPDEGKMDAMSVKVRKTGVKAVKATIDRIRELVVEGRIL